MQDGVIPTVQESQRIAASVRAFERSTSARITSRPQRPRKKVRFDSGGATSPETTGTCPCVKGTGVVVPVVASKFAHRQCFRWLVDGLTTYLNTISGVSIAAGSFLEWNTDDPVNAWVLEFTRTCDAYSQDTYIIMLVEDATWGWKLTVAIEGGDPPNCDDEIDWTFVSADSLSPYPERTNSLRILDTSTKNSEDGDYVNPPSGCVFCLEPETELSTSTMPCGRDIPTTVSVELIGDLAWTTHAQTLVQVSGTRRYISSTTSKAMAESLLVGPHVLQFNGLYAGSLARLTASYITNQGLTWSIQTYSDAALTSPAELVTVYASPFTLELRLHCSLAGILLVNTSGWDLKNAADDTHFMYMESSNTNGIQNNEESSEQRIGNMPWEWGPNGGSLPYSAYAVSVGTFNSGGVYQAGPTVTTNTALYRITQI